MQPYYVDSAITIYHGDCCDVLPALDVEADLLVTDPPYGINWKSNIRERSLEIMQGDSPEDQLNILRAIRLALDKLKHKGGIGGNHVYIFGSLDLSDMLCGGRCELIWDKGHITGGNLDMPWGLQHERITFAVHAACPQNRINGDGNLSARKRKGSIIKVPRLNDWQGKFRHPTEKPVLLLRQLIESSSVIGDLVLDPFMGSGSTLVAARIESRRAIGIEIEENYCEV